MTTPEAENIQPDMNDAIQPKHPASAFSRYNWERVCFIDALTEPLFANLALKYESTDIKWDRAGSWGQPYEQYVDITCTFDCGESGPSVPVVLQLKTFATAPSDWSSITQATLMRPYRESIHFWGNVISVTFGDWFTVRPDSILPVFSYMALQCSTRYKIMSRQAVDTLDLLFTILVELNWVVTENRPWILGFSFPHCWVAHAAKFEAIWKLPCQLKTDDASVKFPFAVRVQHPDPMFFSTVKRLLCDFELDDFPVRRVHLLYDAPNKNRPPTLPFSFHGILKNVVDVKTSVSHDTWDVIEAVLRMNFPKLRRLVSFNAETHHATFRVAQFLLTHRNDVEYMVNLNRARTSKIAKYVVNAKAMRTFIEASAPRMLAFFENAAAAALTQRDKSTPSIKSLFHSRLFEPHVLHMIDRYVHGRDTLDIVRYRDASASVGMPFCETDGMSAAALSMRDL
jgi:hypothetical protein